jgi:hypothetical protein
VDDVAIRLLHAKVWQVGSIRWYAVPEEKARHRFGFASLREDYLNQVQRDFLSRSALQTNTPSECVFLKHRRIVGTPAMTP